MNQETPTAPHEALTSDRSRQIVYVLMSENDGGVAGIVCATRQRAEDELREILAEYVTHDATGPRPSLSAEAIASFVQEMREASINPCRDDWYWIDECPVHL